MKRKHIESDIFNGDERKFAFYQVQQLINDYDDYQEFVWAFEKLSKQ